jgi:hypothetical protein
MSAIANLYNQTSLFLKRAQSLSTRSFINIRLPNALTFQEATEKVLQDLKSLDPNEADAGVKQTNNALLDILNYPIDGKLNPNGIQQAVNQAAKQIKEKAPSDTAKQKNARYLTLLTSVLLNALQKQQQKDNAPETTDQSTAITNETPLQFLQRIYPLATKNQPPTQNDIVQWDRFANTVSQRLNGLNTIQNRTPQQEQEKKTLELITNYFRSHK